MKAQKIYVIVIPGAPGDRELGILQVQVNLTSFFTSYFHTLRLPHRYAAKRSTFSSISLLLDNISKLIFWNMVYQLKYWGNHERGMFLLHFAAYLWGNLKIITNCTRFRFKDVLQFLLIVIYLLLNDIMTRTLLPSCLHNFTFLPTLCSLQWFFLSNSNLLHV